ncbi:helix-turn-helix domain-containing protein [Solitalea sp. MAHUQ-68]|uniref:Helix-turn-helix domain-containing protein n=1 Tax=Solitalea agri TaxID=2953739 RepID=A0A9X2F196_9SPHI|nr:helix-turn-helix domain-containing protein [Solitalea agri]MCO4292290.1 helix-turn-helix domain-containing protein [Solitalea agri]
MELRPIRTDEELDYWAEWLELSLDKKPEKGSELGDKIEMVILLIKDYEDKHYPIPDLDLIETIKYKQTEIGLNQSELAELLGIGKSYLSAILSGKKPLTLTVAKQLHKKLGISADALLV